MSNFLSTVIQVPVITAVIWCLISYGIGYVGSSVVDYIVNKINKKKEISK